jgi:alpha-D-xyloside xylohydrolase
MFGPSLLVAPIFNIENTAEFYLPKGTWTSFWDASIVHEGPKWVTEKNVPFD